MAEPRTNTGGKQVLEWVSDVRSIRRRFAVSGAGVGLLVGLYEAVYRQFVFPFAGLSGAGAGWPIWLVAPLLDVLAFGLLGFLLGSAAQRRGSKARTSTPLWASIGLGLTATFIVCVPLAGFPLPLSHPLGYPYASVVKLSVAFAIGFVASSLTYLALRTWRRSGAVLAKHPRRNAYIFVSVGVPLLAFLVVSGLSARRTTGSPALGRLPASSPPTASQPNIVLITLDTARADHLSAYGYLRPTTPNLDRLARQGVLFENAIAPSSWTLPSFASMFTGLYPHQHGASWQNGLSEEFLTVAELLASRGYVTAGFNSNIVWGQKRLGLGQGFEVYDDGASRFSQNIALTLLGKVFDHFFYYLLIRPQPMEVRDAGETNRAVFEWLRRRPRSPFFLFVNYLDVHDPYMPPTSYPTPFGAMPYPLVRKLHPFLSVPLPAPHLSPEELASAIDGYDNCLAYVDARVGELLERLAAAPEGSNTIIVVTSDHGESFGEHGFLGHGLTLHRELLHVPLLIVGPGIPSGMHIKDLVGTRSIFATIADWAQGGHGPFGRDGLRVFWTPDLGSDLPRRPVVSELDGRATRDGERTAFVSLTTSQYHYIQDARGQVNLYDWHNDPQEENDLAGRSEYAAAESDLRAKLHAAVQRTRQPWLGEGYARALGISGLSFVKAGKGQIPGLPKEYKDLLQSLPYE